MSVDYLIIFSLFKEKNKSEIDRLKIWSGELIKAFVIKGPVHTHNFKKGNMHKIKKCPNHFCWRWLEKHRNG